MLLNQVAARGRDAAALPSVPVSGWRDHPIVERVKPAARAVRDRQGRVVRTVTRIITRWRRRVARLRHHSIPITSLRPEDVREANLDLVLDRLATAGVPARVVRGKRVTRTFVAVGAEHREGVAQALSAGQSAPHLRVQMLRAEQADGSPSTERSKPLSSLATATLPPDLAVLRVFAWHDTTPDALVYGSQYACDVEFWESQKNGWRVAPRANALASQLAPDLFEPVSVEIGGRIRPVARGAHEHVTLDDVTFPIDAVYVLTDRPTPTSMDLLRHSLRSLDMYAPWIRRVHIVVAGAAPSFVLADDRLRIVEHGEIVDRSDRLPLPSWHVVVSFLHNIDELAEHFLLLDDTMFVGRDVQPESFFTAAGQVRVFPAAGMSPLGASRSTDPPREADSTRVAEAIEARYGRRVTHAPRPTPRALTRSLLRRVEDEFGQAIEDTRRQGAEPFPADVVVHHLAQITGDGVRSELSDGCFDLTKVGDASELRALLATRRHDVFSITSGPAEDPSREQIRDVLRRYFPVPSRWER